MRAILALSAVALLASQAPAQYTTCGCNGHFNCVCAANQCACANCGHALPAAPERFTFERFSFERRAVPQFNYAPPAFQYAPPAFYAPPVYRYRQPFERDRRFLGAGVNAGYFERPRAGLGVRAGVGLSVGVGGRSC